MQAMQASLYRNATVLKTFLCFLEGDSEEFVVVHFRIEKM